MISRYDIEGAVWIDVERPTIEEVENLVEEFKFGPLVEQEILTPTAKPRIDLFPTFVYLVLHFPASQDTHGRSQVHEVDLIVAKDLVVTVHYESVPAILDFARSFEAAMLLNRPQGALHAGHVLFELSTRLYQSVEDELDAIEDSVTRIEGAMFQNREREMVKPISLLTRELLNHKRIIAGQGETIQEFARVGATLFGDEFRRFMTSMTSLHYRSHSRAQMLMETLAELRTTNDTLLSTNRNETMKNLTIVASIILPLSLIASLFGMNTENNPITGHPFDFWIVVGILLGVGTLTTLYLYLRKWF